MPAGAAGVVRGGFGAAGAEAAVEAARVGAIGSGVWAPEAGVTLNCGAPGGVMVTVVRGAEMLL